MTSLSVYFLMVLIPLIDAAWFRCDYSYLPYEGWFKLHREPTDHDTAKRVCLKEGAELVSPFARELKMATLSLFANTAIPAIHIDYEAAGQSNKVRREIMKFAAENILEAAGQKFIKSICSNEPIIPTMDKENTIVVMTRNGSFESKPELAETHFICHKKAGTAEELNECGTTDNEYALDTRIGICYKFHRLRNTWPRAREICIREGGKLAVINSETEAQVIRDLFKSNLFDFSHDDIKEELAFVGISSSKDYWQTVDDHPLSITGYEKWGSDGKQTHKGYDCGTVRSNGLLYKNPCDQELPFICEKKIQDCNDKFTPDIRTGNCYRFYRTRAMYDTARKLCMYEGANLAVINSEKDSQAIGDIFNRNPSFFIPGYYGPISALLGKHKDVVRQPENVIFGDYLSMSGYDKWAPGQLKQAFTGEKCVTVKRNGLLHASQCTLVHPFICERTNQDCDGYTLNITMGKCYKFHRMGRTWSNAFAACTNEGGNLAVINSETEAPFFSYIFNSNPSETIIKYGYQDAAFLGIKRPAGIIWDWKTVAGDNTSLNSNSGYDMWAPGEPNNANGDEYCITVRRNGLLSDDPCDQSYPFICEKKIEDCL